MQEDQTHSHILKANTAMCKTLHLSLSNCYGALYDLTVSVQFV